MKKFVPINQTKDARWRSFLFFSMMATFTVLMTINPAYATDAAVRTIQDIVRSMVDIICLAFQAIGVILGTYSVGQLIFAFKNDDADTKSRASTMLVVSVILIAIRPIVDKLNLVEMIG